MANVYSTWRATVGDSYTAAGFTVTFNPATVNPPCVVVGPVETLTNAGLGAHDATASVWLVHPAPAGGIALGWLEDALPGFLAASPPFEACELGAYAHPAGDLPAYRITVQTTIQE